jgi:hypothetical protein
VLALNKSQLRLYQTIQSVAQEQMAIVDSPDFTNEEISQAHYWIEHQNTPVPACVLFTSLNEHISNLDAANQIINSKANYELLNAQIKNIRDQGLTDVMNSTDVYSLKQTAADCMNQIKNIVEQYY